VGHRVRILMVESAKRIAQCLLVALHVHDFTCNSGTMFYFNNLCGPLEIL
jgi:hypothetical protein